MSIAVQFNIPAFILFAFSIIGWHDTSSIVKDWVCTILAIISIVNLIVGIIYSNVHCCMCAAIWMVVYTVVWLMNRECKKPTQLFCAILIALFEAGAIGYLLH